LLSFVQCARCGRLLITTLLVASCSAVCVSFAFQLRVRPALRSLLLPETTIRMLSIYLASVFHHFTCKSLLASFRIEDAHSTWNNFSICLGL